jgi:hypothetical protein
MQPPELAAAIQPSPDLSEQAIKPVNIGGWLLFFVITNYLGCISLALQVSRAAHTTRILLLILMFASTLLPAILVPLRSDLVFLAVWAQFTIRLLATGITAHTIWTLRNASNYPTRPRDITNQIAAVIISLAWLLYFHYSRRVRETFGQNL